MRVIGGKAKRTLLKTVEGMDTRPTTDRIKETLFNMISGEIYDCDFLDLYSGSGAIAIEALSRGAHSAVLVEENRKAAQCIKENLIKTHLEGQAQLMITDCEAALKQLGSKKAHFDIIFMDPPYNYQHEKKMLELIMKEALADQDTLIIVEASLETDFSYLGDMGYEIRREKVYKTNKHLFIGVV